MISRCFSVSIIHLINSQELKIMFNTCLKYLKLSRPTKYSMVWLKMLHWMTLLKDWYNDLILYHTLNKFIQIVIYPKKYFIYKLIIKEFFKQKRIKFWIILFRILFLIKSLKNIFLDFSTNFWSIHNLIY